MKKIITFISDTHSKHQYCENDLPGGDILIHAGDFMNSGYHKKEVIESNSDVKNTSPRILELMNKISYLENA
jgi:predicted phosphodiesterase